MFSHLEEMTDCSKIALASLTVGPQRLLLSPFSLYSHRHRCFKVKVLEPNDLNSNPGAVAY